jgi:hypothetical protein
MKHLFNNPQKPSLFFIKYLFLFLLLFMALALAALFLLLKEQANPFFYAGY